MTDTTSNRPKRITAADVARAAGVSRSAVSRAFTQGSYLDADKRKMILAAAQTLGYRPNALAAGLQGAQSNLVAIFAGDMPNEYDKEVIAALVMGLNGAGHWPIVIGGGGDIARNAVSNVLRYPLESMILRAGSLDADIVAECGKLAIPVISSGRPLDAPGVDNVCCRHAAGVCRAVKLLHTRGRRNFGTISGPPEFYAAIDRRKGLTDTLAQLGLPLRHEEIGDFTVQGGYDATRRLLGHCPDLDSLICANDAMAIGALSAIDDSGRTVGKDISVIGFDDIAMANWPAFRLTTLRNPINALVETILGLLDRRRQDPDKPDETIFLEAELILRASH